MNPHQLAQHRFAMGHLAQQSANQNMVSQTPLIVPQNRMMGANSNPILNQGATSSHMQTPRLTADRLATGDANNMLNMRSDVAGQGSTSNGMQVPQGLGILGG